MSRDYLAYDAPSGETKLCDTLEDAKDWLLYMTRADDEDGFSEDIWFSGVFKITHRINLNTLDRRTDYCEYNPHGCHDCSSCPRYDTDECEGDEWPFGSDADETVELEFVEVGAKKQKRSIAKKGV